MRRAIAAAALALLCGPAVAQAPSYAAFRPSEASLDARMSATYQGCIARAAGVTAQFRDCADAEYRRLDALLEQSYRRVLARLTAARRARLQSEQRSWRAGKAAACRRYVAQNGEGSGSMDLLLMDECGLRELVRRTQWLARYR